MQLSRKAINSRWAWTSGAAVAALLILSLTDSYLRARTGFGAADLQFRSGWGVRSIMDHWTSPPNSALAGFGLGFDYLFIPLYAAALFYGSVAAFDRFAPPAGRVRRLMAILTMAPIAGAVFDVIENTLEVVMLAHGPTDTLADLAIRATAGKFVGVAIGLGLTLMGIVGVFWRKKATKS